MTTSILEPGQDLSYQSLNPTNKPTILLLHGMLSSSKECTNVTPYLNNYHILIPTLPSHGTSTCTSSTIPFTIPSTVALLANLITTQAYGGKAHIVGLSLGGYVALSLTASYPSVVHSVFATGAARRADTLILPSWVIGGFLETVASWTSKKLFFWSQGWDDWNIPEGLYEDLIAAVGRGNVGKLVDAVKSHSGPKVWEKVGVRCLMVAGGREDPVEVTKEAGRILNGVCDQSRAVVVRKVGHAWDLEEPELFAEGVRAWVEGRVLPEEFEIL